MSEAQAETQWTTRTDGVSPDQKVCQGGTTVPSAQDHREAISAPVDHPFGEAQWSTNSPASLWLGLSRYKPGASGRAVETEPPPENWLTSADADPILGVRQRVSSASLTAFLAAFSAVYAKPITHSSSTGGSTR